MRAPCPRGDRLCGIRHLWPPTQSPIICSLRRHWDQIHRQQPVCHMTGAQRSPCLFACVCMRMCVCVRLLFPCWPRRGEPSWMRIRGRRRVCLPLTPPKRVSGRGSAPNANASAGAAPHHAHAGEIGGGQFYGRYGGRRLQRWARRRLGSAAKIPVQPAGVPGTVAGRGGVLGGPRRASDRHPEGDQAAAVVHRLCGVSNLRVRPCFLGNASIPLFFLGGVSAHFLGPPRCQHTHRWLISYYYYCYRLVLDVICITGLGQMEKQLAKYSLQRQPTWYEKARAVKYKHSNI